MMWFWFTEHMKAGGSGQVFALGPVAMLGMPAFDELASISFYKVGEAKFNGIHTNF